MSNNLINVVLKMPITQADGDNGISDGNIETYKNFPMLSLTKEELQNSTDGALPNCESPVVVEFNEFQLDGSQLYDRDYLISVYKDNRNYWDSILENDKKAVLFFDKSISILEQDKIRCLRISDSNTTGLRGIDKQSSPWRNLVKNRGVSDKPGYNGGSFGIGKDAAFACSQVRIVFYNTVNDEGECAFQGVVKLPSYQKNGENYDGIGYFCDNAKEKFEPIRKNISLDSSYKRPIDRYGMDKFIVGFDETIDDLKNEIILSSLNSFLYAFFYNKLIVKCDDITISSETLPHLMDYYKDDKRISHLTKEYYETLINPDTILKTKVFEEDDILIYLKLDSNFSRRAAIVRQTGMKVFDKGHLSGSVGFAAVVILAGNKVNEYFKKLENAEHNQWSDYRGGNEKEIKENQNLIFDFLRSEIKKLHQVNYETSIDADGMNEYLPYSYVTGKKKNTESLTNKIGIIRINPRKKKEELIIEETIKLEFNDIGDIIENSYNLNEGAHTHSGGVKNDFPPYPYPSLGINSDEKRYMEQEDTDFIAKKKVDNNSLKFRIYKNDYDYSLQFSSMKNISKGYIEINISGEQDAMPVKITEASIGHHKLKTSGNKISFMNVKSKSIQVITFKMENNENWAFEVSVYESKK